MSHEPECQLITWGVPVPTCTCTALRAAYQRGREDAAKAVEWWLIEELGQGRDYEAAMAAARGDGGE